MQLWHVTFATGSIALRRYIFWRTGRITARASYDKISRFQLVSTFPSAGAGPCREGAIYRDARACAEMRRALQKEYSKTSNGRIKVKLNDLNLNLTLSSKANAPIAQWGRVVVR